MSEQDFEIEPQAQQEQDGSAESPSQLETSTQTDGTALPYLHEVQGGIGVHGLRLILTILLLLLTVTFIILGVVAWRMLVPLGAPTIAEMPEGITWVRSIYGWGPGENQQLAAPSDVAIGSDGTIWATDPQRWQVVGFRPDGSYRTILHRGPGRMSPQVVAAGEDGEIYVGDTLTSRIRVFDAQNNELRSWPVSMPTEIAVKDGEVVVGMVGALAVYSTDGKLQRAWTGRGRAEDEFDVVHGVAVDDDGTIYASDTQNHRVKAYDPAGALKWVYPTGDATQVADPMREDESKDRPYQIPAGMTIDAAGRLLAVDPFGFAVFVIDKDSGKPTERYGEYGAGEARFAYPTGIDYDSLRDWYAIADTANNRIQVLRLDGSGGLIHPRVRRHFDGPVWVLLAPIVALVLFALTRRWLRRRKEAEQAA